MGDDNNKLVKIIDINNKKVLYTLAVGETIDFLNDQVRIKLLNIEGSYIIEVLKDFKKNIYVNKQKVYDSYEGASGDLIETSDVKVSVVAQSMSCFISSRKNTDIKDEVQFSLSKKYVVNIKNKIILLTLFVLLLFLLSKNITKFKAFDFSRNINFSIKKIFTFIITFKIRF